MKMMMTAAKHQDLTLLFEIPRVNNLLIYKYNWNNSIVMKKMIAEFIDLGQFHMLYFGNRPELIQNKYTPSDPNSALIIVCVSAILVPETYSFQMCKDIFVKELYYNKNLFQFDNWWIDEHKNISSVGVTVTIQHAHQIDTAVSAA